MEDSPVASNDDLSEINKKIAAGFVNSSISPVVATCDVHFLVPEDEVLPRIIWQGRDLKIADEQAPLFLRTTERDAERICLSWK